MKYQLHSNRIRDHKKLNLSNILVKRFSELSERGECGLVCYIMAGYPDAKTSEDVAIAIAQAGADALEIGIPFSDPIADGPTIQEASDCALRNGMTPNKSLKIADKIKRKFPALPLIVMTYSNILVKEGLSQFINKAKLHGIDGFIVPDMSIEESNTYVKIASEIGLATIFLASPNTPQKRLHSIINKSSGFLYMVSVQGTTGIRQHFEDYTLNAVRKVKEKTKHSKIPLAVGFGISNPSQVEALIKAGADSVIIASAVISILSKHHHHRRRKNRYEEVQSFVTTMKNVCKAHSPILIQQGENYSQTPMQQAFLLQQGLTEARHPDHTLITYPDLGHSFSPSSQWRSGLEPIQQNVLQDLFAWLSDPVREFKELTILQKE